MPWFGNRKRIEKRQLCICLQVLRQNKPSWPFFKDRVTATGSDPTMITGEEEGAPSESKRPTRSYKISQPRRAIISNRDSRTTKLCRV